MQQFNHQARGHSAVGAGGNQRPEIQLIPDHARHRLAGWMTDRRPDYFLKRRTASTANAPMPSSGRIAGAGTLNSPTANAGIAVIAKIEKVISLLIVISLYKQKFIDKIMSHRIRGMSRVCRSRPAPYEAPRRNSPRRCSLTGVKQGICQRAGANCFCARTDPTASPQMQQKAL